MSDLVATLYGLPTKWQDPIIQARVGKKLLRAHPIYHMHAMQYGPDLEVMYGEATILLPRIRCGMRDVPTVSMFPGRATLSLHFPRPARCTSLTSLHACITAKVEMAAFIVVRVRNMHSGVVEVPPTLLVFTLRGDAEVASSKVMPSCRAAENNGELLFVELHWLGLVRKPAA